MDQDPFRRLNADQPQPRSNPLRNFVIFVFSAVLVVLGLVFSAVILLVALAIGSMVFAWFWWKTRALRRQMREQMLQAAATGEARQQARQGDAGSGTVIEGEIIDVENETKVEPKDRR